MQCHGPPITQDSFLKITPQQSQLVYQKIEIEHHRIVILQWKRAVFIAEVVVAMQVNSVSNIANTTFDAGFLLWKKECLVCLLELEKDLWTKCLMVKKIG